MLLRSDAADACLLCRGGLLVPSIPLQVIYLPQNRKFLGKITRVIIYQNAEIVFSKNVFDRAIVTLISDQCCWFVYAVNLQEKNLFRQNSLALLVRPLEEKKNLTNRLPLLSFLGGSFENEQINPDIFSNVTSEIDRLNDCMAHIRESRRSVVPKSKFLQ